MHLLAKASFFALAVNIALAAFSYENFKVYKIEPKSEKENAYLKAFRSNPDFDFWSKLNRVGNPVSVMVAPQSQKKFETFLSANKIKFEIQIEDVERNIQAEREYHKSRPIYKSGRINFKQYYRHEEINAYLEEVAANYTDLVTLDTAGESYEGRDMKLIRISTGSTPPKPVLFIDAGIHAREWIAPALALYIINQLLENSTNSYLLDNLDWVILPSANPDGYAYSWDQERLWRKTRSPGVLCDGCDPNRNFAFHWMESGASSNECSETYAGTEAFSEVETRNLRDYLASDPNITAYYTLHSYGQYLLYPWGYDSSLCENWEELDELGHAIDDAISAVRGTSYLVGGAGAALYAAAGASDDWSRSTGIEVVYTMELPGGGPNGFDLPATEIQGVVEESFEGIKVLANYVANRH